MSDDKKIVISDLVGQDVLFETLEQAGVSITLADANQVDYPLIYVNKAFEDLTGYSAKEAIGKNCRFLQKNQGDIQQHHLMRQALKEGKPCEVILHNFTKSGHKFLNKISLIPIKQEGKLRFFMGFQRDLNAKSSELINYLATSQENLNTLVDHMSEGVVFHAASGDIISVNAAAEEILGLTLSQIKGTTSLDPRWHCIHEDGSEYPGETHPVMRVINEPQIILNDIMGIYHADGSLRWISISAAPIKKPEELSDGNHGYIVVIFKEITQQRQLEFLANHDELSGLYNRRFFNKNFTSLIHKAPQEGSYWFFVMLDIDLFKLYNDFFGHQVGDEIIEFIGQLLNEISNDRAYHFRMGGEEFASLFQARSLDAALNLLKTLQEKIATCEYKHPDTLLNHLTVSMGLMPCNPNEAIRYHFQKADQALYSAKENGRNQVVVAS